MVKRVLNKFVKLEKETPGFFAIRDGNHGLPRHGCNDSNTEFIFYHETETRYYWMYVKKGKN